MSASIPDHSFEGPSGDAFSPKSLRASALFSAATAAAAGLSWMSESSWMSGGESGAVTATGKKHVSKVAVRDEKVRLSAYDMYGGEGESHERRE